MALSKPFFYIISGGRRRVHGGTTVPPTSSVSVFLSPHSSPFSPSTALHWTDEVLKVLSASSPSVLSRLVLRTTASSAYGRRVTVVDKARPYALLDFFYCVVIILGDFDFFFFGVETWDMIRTISRVLVSFGEDEELGNKWLPGWRVKN